MRAVKRKLKSQHGASITFALLIFLVCAVVGSAVLTAGTAASGRMSKIAEMDQRYYSVNSAAKLVIDQIQKTKSFVKKKNPARKHHLILTMIITQKGRANHPFRHRITS